MRGKGGTVVVIYWLNTITQLIRSCLQNRSTEIHVNTVKILNIKDGASFCYCAYVLPILGYSGFLRNLPPNTTIFLCGLWLRGKSSSQQELSESKKKIGGNHAFFTDNWASIWKEIAMYSLYFNAFWEIWLLHYLSKMRGYPVHIFLFGFQ